MRTFRICALGIAAIGGTALVFIPPLVGRAPSHPTGEIERLLDVFEQTAWWIAGTGIVLGVGIGALLTTLFMIPKEKPDPNHTSDGIRQPADGLTKPSR